MRNNILLLSIRPEHAKKIFNGTKKVELRRIKPRRIDVGCKVLVYVSSPVKALVGYFEIEQIIEELPNKLWGRVQYEAGLDREQFDNYYNGASIGIGIYLQKIRRFSQPLDLSQIRKLWKNFYPPQCYRYLKPEEVNLIGLRF